VSKGTPLRNVRIPDDLWTRALARATAEGTTVSAKIVQTLEDWVGGPSDDG
jgi:hypothetical protein